MTAMEGVFIVKGWVLRMHRIGLQDEEELLLCGKNGIDDPVAHETRAGQGESWMGIGREINPCISFQSTYANHPA